MRAAYNDHIDRRHRRFSCRALRGFHISPNQGMVSVWKMRVNIGLFCPAIVVVVVVVVVRRVYVARNHSPPHFCIRTPSMMTMIMVMGHCRPHDPQGRYPFLGVRPLILSLSVSFSSLNRYCFKQWPAFQTAREGLQHPDFQTAYLFLFFLWRTSTTNATR